MARPSTAAKRMVTTTLDQETLYSLHRVLLGHEQRDMPPAWAGGFSFRERGLRCGLLQREGGPCGVLAAVQAYVLRELYLAAPEPVDLANVSSEAAGDALLKALTHIVWSARVGRVASVVNCKAAVLPPLRAAAGELSVTQCGSAADVLSTLRACLGAYKREGGPGIALLLYSVTLTRGIAMVGRDADFPTSLIGANGYCSQELVNLLLLGRGHSNVFNGEQVVGGAPGDEGVGLGATMTSMGLGGVGSLADALGKTTAAPTPAEPEGCRLRGVPRRALVGFLTLFEKQEGGGHALLTVGSHYKRPAAPIFVVQSESHYSVLWAADGSTPPDVLPDGEERLPGDPEGAMGDEDEDEDERPMQLPTGGAFDLAYFDQMAERDEAVRLTLRRAVGGGGNERGHLPPLETVILTRWPAAEIDWNGEEVIL